MFKKKPLITLVSLLAILCVTVGGTLAFLIDTDGPITNLFNPSKVTTEVIEELNGTTKQNVMIKNTGDTDAWIRAAVVVTWQDAQGNVYGQEPEEGTDKDYTISYNVSDTVSANCWVEGNDGFYYWTSPVAAKTGLTGILIDSCTASGTKVVGTGDDAVTYYLTVEIIGSGIQNKPANVFNTEWASSGLKVNNTPQNDPMQWTLIKK